MTDKDQTTDNVEHPNFEAPATLRKWPSMKCERLPLESGASSYLVFGGTFDQCIRQMNEKPHGHRRLYEIHTEPQGPTLAAVLTAGLAMSRWDGGRGDLGQSAGGGSSALRCTR